MFKYNDHITCIFNPQAAEWHGDWTEETATEFCTNLILKNSVVETCIPEVDVDVTGDVESCILDIKVKQYTTIGYNQNVLSSTGTGTILFALVKRKPECLLTVM